MDLWGNWDELDTEDRHRVVRALAEQVEVGPTLEGRTLYSPER